jgi:hypothetical protein
MLLKAVWMRRPRYQDMFVYWMCSLYLVCALYVVCSSAIDLLGWLLLSSTAVRFWSGFTRTTYNSSASTKLGMTALWPGVFSPPFWQVCSAVLRCQLSWEPALRCVILNVLFFLWNIVMWSRFQILLFNQSTYQSAIAWGAMLRSEFKGL